MLVYALTFQPTGRKKGRIFVAFNPLTYVKESRAELGKVIWPTRRETIRLTIVVVLVSILVGAYIAGLDALFAKIAEKVLYK